jgi:hypothetical protein
VALGEEFGRLTAFPAVSLVSGITPPRVAILA